MTEDFQTPVDAPARDSDLLTPGAVPPKPSVPKGVVLAVIILGLLGVVAILLMQKAAPARADSEALASLQAEYAALRESYNREAVAMGRPPIDGHSEPVEDIAGRLKSDSESLIALVTSYQDLLSSKEAELASRSAELLRGEKLRANLVAENARLQGDLQTSLASRGDALRLQQDLANAQSRYDAVAAELNVAREKLRTLSDSVPQDDYSELQRRLAETTRAKEFFEARVKELEGTEKK